MKIKDGFILRQVAGSYLVISVGGESVDFNGMITVNETGAFLWEKLTAGATEAELLDAMLAEYEVDAETATVGDLVHFLQGNDIWSFRKDSLHKPFQFFCVVFFLQGMGVQCQQFHVLTSFFTFPFFIFCLSAHNIA